MANPFLMDDDLPSNDAASNPFLMETTADEDEALNPFAEQMGNPFMIDTGADGTNDASAAPINSVSDIFSNLNNDHSNDAVQANLFGDTDDSLNADFSMKNQQLSHLNDTKDAYSSDEELMKQKIQPAVSKTQATQDLIFAITDQLDHASNQMLERLPVTRTPSPVSMRDLHSPSPVPEGIDFFGMDDDNVGTLPLEVAQSGVDLLADDSSNKNSAVDISTQPVRPPPPRPAPPPRPPTQPTPKPSQPEPDLFFMSDEQVSKPSRPPAPKTKEDILSLFAAPKAQPAPTVAQQDLLSGDILLDSIQAVDTSLPPPLTEQLVSDSLINTSVAAPPPIPPQPVIPPIVTQAQDFSSFPPTSPSQAVSSPEKDQEQAVVDKAENVEEIEVKAETKSLVLDTIPPHIFDKRTLTPDIEITTVEDLPRSDDEEEEEKQPSSVSDAESEQNLKKDDVDSDDSKTINQESDKMDTELDMVTSNPSGSVSANPFASPELETATTSFTAAPTNIFAMEEPITAVPAYEVGQIYNSTNAFGIDTTPTLIQSNITEPASNISYAQTSNGGLQFDPMNDEFDAFSAKFESTKKDNIDDAWGNTTAPITTTSALDDDGFGAEEGFDSFLAMQAPPEIETPEEKEFSVVIRPKDDYRSQGAAPMIAPPPPPPRGTQNTSNFTEAALPRVNPFDKSEAPMSLEGITPVISAEPVSMKRSDSQETPTTPLFDEDVSQPLEDFPRLNYQGPGWEMQLRHPNKKKITGQRFWKKVFVRLVFQGDNPVLQLFNEKGDKDPFQELPLQPSYSVSEIGAQQYDQFGKIFTIKFQYIFYKERPGVRPGQITKAERITNKLSQFAAYAIQGDYAGVKEFGSDLKKLGLPVEHAPQVSQLLKLGSMNYEDLKQFSVCIEEALFKLHAHRDRALTYKMEEVQVTAVDEIYVEQDAEGHVHKQIARVRLFFLAFLSGMPTIELGLNDLVRQGKEVVGRHDIIPVVTEEWIRLENVEFHSVIQQDEYERTRTIKFQPPDACYIELMRFRVRPPKNRELPLQLKATWCVTGNRVELRADILVPGFASRKLGQIPCEDVAIRFPIPECWIYLFRVEKHFRYGSVKSAHRRTGKIKGIERILGAVDQLQESLIEVTSGQAKYEHPHRALVWRCSRLPKEGQGAYTTHQLVCRMALTSYDQIPEQLAPYCYVEFTMPATQVSHTTVRSVSVQESDSDEPPEKYVRYLARHEYRVGIEHTTGETVNPYLIATKVEEKRSNTLQPPSPQPPGPSDSDSDSN